MIAAITGASSGIGKEMAKYLSKLGYDVIAIARERTRLEETKKEIEEEYHNKVQILVADLSKTVECIRVHKDIRENYGLVDIFINNAGFGLFGEFTQTNLEIELEMIDTNMKAVHILTKLFLNDMIKQDKGYILNVGSIASFMPGPLMATYYASKSYVLRMTQAIQEELRKKKSRVHVCILCPGPVDTNFNQVAKVRFHLKEASSKDIAKYGIDRMLKRKRIIIPQMKIKMARLLSKIAPDWIVGKVCYRMQEKKK